MRLRVGKRHKPLFIATFSNGSRNRHIFITDKTSKIAFLIDTDSDVSVFPRKKVSGLSRKCDYEVYVANGIRIATYEQLLWIWISH